jgi:hypothetical protein
MNIASKGSGHWTDDQLIEHLYGVGPEDGHLDACAECQSRLSGMQERRRLVISDEAIGSEDVSIERLAAQRRRVYFRLTETPSWSSRLHVRRWASASAVALVFSGGILYYNDYQQQRARDAMLSDAQLAQDVSRLSEDPEAQPTAPLEALFDE